MPEAVTRHTLFFFARFEPGDNPCNFPGKGTPAGEGLCAALRAYGVMKPDSTERTRPIKVKRGVFADFGYFWQVDWLE